MNHDDGCLSWCDVPEQKPSAYAFQFLPKVIVLNNL